MRLCTLFHLYADGNLLENLPVVLCFLLVVPIPRCNLIYMRMKILFHEWTSGGYHVLLKNMLVAIFL